MIPSLKSIPNDSAGFGLALNVPQSSASTLAYNNTTATNQQLLLNTGSMVLNADLTVQNISATTTLANVINISLSLLALLRRRRP